MCSKKKQKYYATWGSNGYGVFDEYDKAVEVRKELEKSNCKGFPSQKQALYCAREMHVANKDYIDDFEVEEDNRINRLAVYRKKNAAFTFEPKFSWIEDQVTTTVDTYYGVIGINGYGIYTDKDKMEKNSQHVILEKRKEFDSREEASEGIIEMYKEIGYGFVNIDYPKYDNWFYYTRGKY